jgi:sec-independent protein translocase protein TatC
LPDEKRKSIGIWLVMAFLLAILGILFAYFLAIPFALKFLINFASKAAIPMISIGQYLSFTGALILVGAGIFQIPVAIAFLSEIGIVKNSFLRKNRKYVLILILIISAIITPTQDIFNMLVFAVPMYCLYEIGIFVSWLIEKKKRNDKFQITNDK